MAEVTSKTPDVGTQEDAVYLRLLNHAAVHLLTADNPKAAVRELFGMIAGELGLDVYFNYLFQDGELRLASSHGLTLGQEIGGDCLQLGAAVCGMVAASRQPHHAQNVQASDDPQLAFIKDVGLNCYACTPMLVGDRLLGTLGFGRRSAPCFSEGEVQFLRTITRYVAMAYDRLRMEAALRDSEQRLNAVLDNTLLAVFLLDERQQCTYMNAAAEKLTGYSFAEIQGRTLHEVVHHTRPDGEPFPLSDCPINQALGENAQRQGEATFVHKDGSFYPVAFTASPIRDEASHTVGTIVEVRDIAAEKRNQQARDLLMREVDHRARNALAVVQSVLQLTRAPDIEAYKAIVFGRVSAIARAQGSLAERQWEGAELDRLVRDEIAALPDGRAVSIEGDRMSVRPEQAQPLSMILHELTTNAQKYGALSRPSGRVTVRWVRLGERIRLAWREEGGPVAAPPERLGFGTRMIQQLARQLDAQLGLDWPETGLVLHLEWRA